MVAPPLFTGAMKLTVAEALPFTAVADVGVLGTVEGVTEALLAEAALVPALLVAVTLQV